MNIKLFSIIGISIILLIGKLFKSDCKSLSCNSVLKENLNYKSFKGISFETEKSVRVVTLKMKNNQLKVVSKSFLIRQIKTIFFKIKFICMVIYFSKNLI